MKKRDKKRNDIIDALSEKFGDKAFNYKDIGMILGRDNGRGLGQMLNVMIRKGKICKCGTTLYKIKQAREPLDISEIMHEKNET